MVRVLVHRAVLDVLETELTRKKITLVRAARPRVRGAVHPLCIDSPCLLYIRAHQVRIDGQTPPSTRQSFVDHFQRSKAVRVALLSICACGTHPTGRMRGTAMAEPYVRQARSPPRLRVWQAKASR